MSEQGGPYGPGGQPNPGQGPQGWQQGPPPTGQGWQQQPPTGPQGWQPGPPPGGPQGQQPPGPQGWQGQPPAGPQGPQGWQQGQPTGPQGWQQGPPPTQGFPAGQQPWSGQPGQPTPPTSSRKPIIITAIAVVVALIAGVGIYFLAIRDSGNSVASTGAKSPQDSVTALFNTLGNSDPIGIADQLDPAEAALFTDLNSDVITELKRLEVLSPEASADKMTGTTIKVEGLTMEPTTETINDHLQIVKLTGGTVTIASDPNQIPLSDGFKSKFGAEIDQAQPESQTVNIADAVKENGEPIRVATVKRGDDWYVSFFYTIADNAVHAEGLPNPSAADYIAPVGSASPEAAVDAMIKAGTAGDVKSVIALLPPDEMGVLHDYGQVILDQTDAGELTTEMADLGFELGPITYDVTDVTGGKKVSFTSIELTADGQTATIKRDPAAGSVTLTAPGEAPITLDESTIDTYLSDAIGSSDELDAQALDIIKREFKQLIGLGFVTVQVDGQWYVSPVRSFSDIFVSLMKGLEPGDVEYLIELSGN